MAEAYQPISCVDHERLEFAVLKQQWLDIEVLTSESPRKCRLLPVDVYARSGVEWLDVMTESGEKLTLRLDQIRFY